MDYMTTLSKIFAAFISNPGFSSVFQSFLSNSGIPKFPGSAHELLLGCPMLLTAALKVFFVIMTEIGETYLSLIILAVTNSLRTPMDKTS